MGWEQADLIAPPGSRATALPAQGSAPVPPPLISPGLSDLSPSRVPTLASSLQAGPHFPVSVTMACSSVRKFFAHFRGAQGSPQLSYVQKLSAPQFPTAQSRFSVTSYAMKLKHAWPFPVVPVCTPLGPLGLFQVQTNRVRWGQGKLGMTIFCKAPPRTSCALHSVMSRSFALSF